MNRHIVFLLVFICFAAALPAGGKKEKETVIQVTGRVRLVGSSAFTQIVISGADREWYVPKEEEHKLMDLQQRTVTVEGVETVVEITFASGMPAGTRHTLSKIKIISIQ